jgi:hypothetical protein
VPAKAAQPPHAPAFALLALRRFTGSALQLRSRSQRVRGQCELNGQWAVRPSSGASADSFENFYASQQGLCLAASVLQRGVDMGRACDRVLDRVNSNHLGLLALLELRLAAFPVVMPERSVKHGKYGHYNSQEKQWDKYKPIDSCHRYGSTPVTSLDSPDSRNNPNRASSPRGVHLSAA